MLSKQKLDFFLYFELYRKPIESLTSAVIIKFQSDIELVFFQLLLVWHNSNFFKNRNLIFVFRYIFCFVNRSE